MKRATLALLCCCFAPAALAGADDYRGEWSYQALNAGDTSFKVEHKGAEVTFYRVLYPEYEGSRYKLEHIYRGRLKGDQIAGDMYVREEGMAEFERLRAFSGQVLDADHMRMDDLPLRRVASGPAQVATADRPRYQKVVIREGARDKKSPQAPADPPAPAPSDPPPPTGKAVQDAPAEKPAPSPPAPERLAQAAPLTIPTLVPVGRKIAASAAAQKATDLLKRGDREYEQKRYSQALASYEQAFAQDPTRIELLYKLGLCHGILGSRALRADSRAQAHTHYAKAIGFWERAARLDPYNWGAQENMRRARLKLKKLAG